MSWENIATFPNTLWPLQPCRQSETTGASNVFVIVVAMEDQSEKESNTADEPRVL